MHGLQAPAPTPAGERQIYPLSELQGACPAGVLATEKELHLSDGEFSSALVSLRHVCSLAPLSLVPSDSLFCTTCLTPSLKTAAGGDKGRI